MVEFALIVPAFVVLVFGALVVYSWQLDVDSAQFAAEEGLQTAAVPPTAQNANGLLCSAGARAYQALISKSFIGKTTLLGGTTLPSVCAGASVSNPLPNFQTGVSCPSSATQTYSTMLGWLKTASGGQRDVAMVCISCVDVTHAGPCGSGGESATDQAQLTVTVVGYKPLFVGVPFIGNRIPYYGQDTQTVQEFQ